MNEFNTQDFIELILGEGCSSLGFDKEYPVVQRFINPNSTARQRLVLIDTSEEDMTVDTAFGFLLDLGLSDVIERLDGLYDFKSVSNRLDIVGFPKHIIGDTPGLEPTS